MPRSRKGRSKKPVVTYQTYIFRIASWEPSYSFSLNNGGLRRGPYWEHVELTLTGECIAPAKHAGRVGQLIFLGDREEQRALEEPPEGDWKPLGVGGITMRRDRTEFLGSVPMDALWGMIPALASGYLNFVDLYGERLRYGSARVRSINFCKEIDPDHLEGAL